MDIISLFKILLYGAVFVLVENILLYAVITNENKRSKKDYYIITGEEENKKKGGQK